MVYTTVRFKIIPNPNAQPISIGEENVPNPPAGQGAIDWLLQLFQQGGGYPPIQFPTPSTGTGGTGGGGGTIEEPPSPTTCPAGYALNNNNQCVLIPIGTGVGDITNVEVPNTSTPGGNIIIKTWFKNTHTQTLEYKVIVTITGLGIAVTSPALAVAPGQTAMIETTITIPAGATAGSYSGTVQLIALSPGTSGVVLQETQTFTQVVGTTGGGGGGGGTASIVPSVSTIAAGGTFSIAYSGFNSTETVDFVAKVGTTIVGTDWKEGSFATLGTFDISASAPAGVATITATGRTSGKTATATVTITAPTGGGGGGGTTTCPTGNIALSVRKSTTTARRYEVIWPSAGFKQGEMLAVQFFDNATGTRFAAVGEDVEGPDDGLYVSVPTGITCVKMQIDGPESGKSATAYFVPI